MSITICKKSRVFSDAMQILLLINLDFTERNKSVLACATNRMQFIHLLRVKQGDFHSLSLQCWFFFYWRVSY